MLGTVGAHSFCLFVFVSFHSVVRRTYSLVFASARYAAVVNRVPLVPELGWELYRDKSLLAGGNHDGVDSFKVCQIPAGYTA